MAVGWTFSYHSADTGPIATDRPSVQDPEPLTAASVTVLRSRVSETLGHEGLVVH